MTYSCSICGDKFEYKRDKIRHQKYCGVTRIDEYENGKKLQKLSNLTDAMRRALENDEEEKDDTRQTHFTEKILQSS